MICNFLKQHRLETLHTRDLTKELAASLAGQRCAFGRSRIGVGCEARFSRSVSNYLGSVAVAGSASCYSSFVDFITWAYEPDQNPWDTL
jgi:hypothetical protein